VTQVRRRILLSAIAAAAAARGASGQTEPKPVIAILALGMSTAAGFGRVREQLRALGMVEGRDYTVVIRDAGGDTAKLQVLAADLLAHHPAVVLLGGHVAAGAVEALSRTTPIVINGMNDPVAAGLVASLARPGGNITGVANISDAAEARLVEILREMLPAARRIGVVTNPTNQSLRPMLETFRRRAAPFGMKVEAVEVAHPNDLDATFAAIGRSPPDALMVLLDATLQLLSADIVARALVRRVPCFGTLSFQFVESGALFSYVKDSEETARSVALLVSRILRGESPAELPVEQPTRFHLRINLGTARTLGIAVPQSLMAKADSVLD
jgi:putative ABC transport system substrate-binding protein